MRNGLFKKLIPVMFALLFFCVLDFQVNAVPSSEDEALTFQIEHFNYRVRRNADQSDMPPGFTLTDWEYNGVAVKAGKTENSDMICVMGVDLESNSEYRFIYDPEHDLFVPYFGDEIKGGYFYTIPIYEGAKTPYGFVESFFVFQTVPMFTYMREDAELTQEEIAVGSLSEDNYLVLLMMNEKGEEVYYTYDLIDRTFQRSLLQLKDAEKVAELNEVIDGLNEEIGKLNAMHSERMNKRLTFIGILLAIVFILVGVLVNLMLKISRMKKGEEFEDEDEIDDEDVEDYEEHDDNEEDEEEEEQEEVPVKSSPKKTSIPQYDDFEDIEIIDLDLED